MVLVSHLHILSDLIQDAGAHFRSVCVNKLSFMVTLMSSFQCTASSSLRWTVVLLQEDSEDVHPIIHPLIAADWMTTSGH